MAPSKITGEALKLIPESEIFPSRRNITLKSSRFVARKAFEPRNLERPSPPDDRKYPVTMLENGLVSMKVTPEYLIDAVQRNATESPLLLLPAEIRNRIFKYVMGGSLVSIGKRTSNRASKTWCQNSTSLWHGRAAHLGDRRFKSRGTAFHLPEVCRQIYAETATLGYATNTFNLQESWTTNFDPKLRSWLWQRNAAQLSAISSIQPCDFDKRGPTNSRPRLFKKRMSSLREIYVLAASQYPTGYSHEHYSANKRQRIMNKIRKIEGKNMKVIFYYEKSIHL